VIYPSERFSDATASLNDKEEAVRVLYSSKERFKQIVYIRKSELLRCADGFIDNSILLMSFRVHLFVVQ
jgi:hypothetical protein